jgi:hypothetical protein
LGDGVRAKNTYLRLILEAVVIVGSILLAFAIQARWRMNWRALTPTK